MGRKPKIPDGPTIPNGPAIPDGPTILYGDGSNNSLTKNNPEFPEGYNEIKKEEVQQRISPELSKGNSTS